MGNTEVENMESEGICMIVLRLSPHPKGKHSQKLLLWQDTQCHSFVHDSCVIPVKCHTFPEL